MLAGRGTINGATTIGTDPTNVGILRPGQTGGNADGTLTFGGSLTVNDGSQIQLGITSTTVNDSAFITSGQTAFDYLTANPTAYTDNTTGWTTATAGHDFLNIAGSLSLGTGSLTNSTVLVTTTSYTGTIGDVFNLLDWAGVGTTAFTGAFAHTASGNTITGNGDLSLPQLSAGQAWDTTAFQTYGVVAVVALVPEPGRAMLLLFGLMALGLRRRRKMD